MEKQLANIDSRLAQTPVTTNATDLASRAAAEAQRGEVTSVHRVADAFDMYGGKGLMFARAMRASAALVKAPHGTDQAATLRAWKLPENMLDRTNEQRVNRALSEGTGAAGGTMDPDRYATEVIEILRAKLVVLKAGIPSIQMEGQSMTLPRQATDVTGAWVGEQQDAPATGLTTDAVQLSLKKYMAHVPVSNDLLRDAIVAADVLVRDSLIAVAMLALDLAMLRGAGTQYTPRGIRNATVSGNIFSSSAGSGANTLTTALSDLAKLGFLIDNANVPQVKPALFCNPRYKWGLYQLRDSVGRPFFEDMFETKMLQGVPYYDTTQIPNTLSGGGSGGSQESEVYRIEATQWLMGLGMMPTIETSREAAYPDANSTMQSSFTRDETLIRVVVRADLQPRHPQSAAVAIGNTLQ
jgi:HK97 family phage major capsid protein